ncbi:retrotransposon protein, putative, ty1-copia subclass [Tanacetum coccineum]|uniref:Retrotransposon protein, putative, ty1-copia subclass n=1 Tax=Tanacetum coccineum TaxID=301880 RepID=A0ABQ4XYN7_9ASTR
MYDNQVWNLVETTPGLKTVGCKWIFKKKTVMDGKVHTYKARLVAKGYTQTHEIDYKETFSPVSKIKSIRIMLAIAKFHDYEIWQMDVKTAFLNEKLIKDVFMAQLEGFENAKDRSKRLIGISQDTYLDKILKRFKMENSKKGNLPLHHGIKISNDLCPKTDEELDRMSRVPYALVVVSIMYAMTCTRPDVSFALSMKTDKDDSRSQSGWVFLLNRGAVTWKSSKQDIVADSTFALTKEPKDHGKSKHIERKYHFVRSKVEKGHVIVKHIRSEDNPVDPFTKALAKSRHDEHAKSIGLKDNIKF